MAYTEIKSKRQEILEAAGFLFREKGYTATHMKDIAEKVNMEAASLYNHINSKHEILSDLLMYIAHKFQNGMKNIVESSYSDFDKIKAIIALHIRLTTENTHCISLLTQDWKHLKEPDLKAFRKIRMKYSEDFSQILQAAMDKGEIKKANPEITLNSILSSVRWLYDWYTVDNDISPVELEIQISDLLISGFSIR